MRLPKFLEGNDLIANILLAPIAGLLLLSVVGICLNVWRDGPLAMLAIIVLPLFPFFVMPAQMILYFIGRDQNIRLNVRISLAALSYFLLVSLGVWAWAHRDGLAETSTSALALNFVAFGMAGISAIAGIFAKRVGSIDE